MFAGYDCGYYFVKIDGDSFMYEVKPLFKLGYLTFLNLKRDNYILILKKRDLV